MKKLLKAENLPDKSTAIQGSIKTLTGKFQLRADFYKYTILKSDAKFAGKICDYVALDYPAFKYYDYTVKDKETVLSIARKLSVSEFMIAEKNKLPGYGALEKGKVIKVPNLYGKKIVMYIDKIQHMPLNTIVYDEIGIYEYYEYHNLVLNPPYKSDEFSSSFNEYHF